MRRSIRLQTTVNTAKSTNQAPPSTPAIASTSVATASSRPAAGDDEAVGALLALTAGRPGGAAAFEIAHGLIIGPMISGVSSGLDCMPTFEERAALPYAGVRRTVTMDGLADTIDREFPALFGRLAADGRRRPGRRSSAT